MLAKEAAMQQSEYDAAVRFNATVAEREKREEEKKKRAKEVSD